MKRLLVTVMTLILFAGFSELQGQRNFTLVWDGGNGGADPDLTGPLPPNLIRAWGMIGNTQFGPLDVDKDQLNEFVSYDATNKRIFVWETTGDNEYAVVWHKDKNNDAGESTLFGGERSVIMTDLDEDGNFELINIWDSFSPGIIDTKFTAFDSTSIDSFVVKDVPDTTIVGTDTTIVLADTFYTPTDTLFSGGFDALELWEHDPAVGAPFLPDTPTLTFDPPRNSRGRIALEFMSVAADVDGDGVTELILTYRDKFGLILSIISLPDKHLDSSWVVEYVDSTVAGGDSTEVNWQVHSMTVGDINNDGKQDMVVQIDGDDMPIIVYTATGFNTYSKVVFDSSMYHSEYHGSAAKLIIADINNNGKKEIYLGSRGGNLMVVSDITDIDSAFVASKFTLIENIPTFEGRTSEKVELRGGAWGDADNNGRKGFYVTARDPYEAIYELEWIGGTGGDVTEPDNYQLFNIWHADTTDDVTTGFVAMAIGDYDGDGPGHQDIVFTTGNGNEGVEPGIYLIEFDATGLSIASGRSTPEAFSLHQNYPNPFNPATMIVYDMHEAGDVKLVIYNVLGQEVKTLFSGVKSVGRHETLWNGKDRNGRSMSSGVYFYSLKSAGFTAIRKMVLLK